MLQEAAVLLVDGQSLILGCSSLPMPRQPKLTLSTLLSHIHHPVRYIFFHSSLCDNDFNSLILLTAGYGTATYMSPSATQVAGKVGLQTNNVKSPSSNSQYSSYSSNHPMTEASSPRHRSSGLQANALPNAMHTQILTGAAVFPSGSMSSHMGGVVGSTSGYNSISSSYQVAQYGDESPPLESMSPYYAGGSGDISSLNMPLQHQLVGQQYQMLGIQQPLGGALGTVGHQSLGSYHGHHHHHHSSASRSHSQQDSPMTGVQMQQSPVPSS